MRKDTHYPPLCVCPYKPGVGRQRGDTFRESSREQSQCQSASRRNLEYSQLCSGPAYNSTYSTCIHCNLFNLNKSIYIFNLAEALSSAFTL
jgi:hypothetical protein